MLSVGRCKTRPLRLRKGEKMATRKKLQIDFVLGLKDELGIE